MDEKKKKIEMTKTLLRSVVGSSKEVIANKLQGEYRSIVGEFIPYQNMGFPNLHAFIETIPDVVRIGRNVNGEVVYKEVPNEATAHLASFTKATKKKSSKAKPRSGYMRRPAQSKPAFSRGGFGGGTRGCGGFGGGTRGRGTFRGSFRGAPRGGALRGAVLRGAAPRGAASRSAAPRGAASYSDALRGIFRPLTPRQQTVTMNPVTRFPSAHISRPRFTTPRPSLGVPTRGPTSVRPLITPEFPPVRDQSTERFHLPQSTEHFHLPQSTESFHLPQSTESFHLPHSSSNWRTSEPKSVVQVAPPQIPTTHMRQERSHSEGWRGNSRSFSNALKQATNQPVPKKEGVREEVAAAAAAAVSRMKDVPPRYARLNAQSVQQNNPEPQTHNPEPQTHNPEPQTHNPEPQTHNPEPQIHNPEPQIHSPEPQATDSELQTGDPEQPELQIPDREEKISEFERPTFGNGMGEGPELGGMPKEEEGSFNQLVMPMIKSLITDYKMLLLHHCQRWRTRPIYEHIQVGSRINEGYACVIKVQEQTFGSCGIFGSIKEAEVAAAKNACEGLGLLKYDSKSQSCPRKSPEKNCDYDEELVQKRVKEILELKMNGLFSSRLKFEYKEHFKETAPDDLLDRLADWPDIVAIEIMEATNRQILYPSRQKMAVKLSSNSSLTLSHVPDTVMPRPGSRVDVFMSQVYDCSHFFVRKQSTELDELMTQLQEIYNGRGSPKQLIQPEVGMHCVALFTDEQWYRAEILNINKKNSEDVFDVLYIDYGNCETVTSMRVRRILDNMCTLPTQAIRCSLIDCYPPQGEDWDDDSKAVSEMISITMAEDIQLITDVINVDSDHGCIVKLYDSENLTEDLTSHLVKKGFASAEPVTAEPGMLDLPAGDEWDVFVCYINTTTDIVVRLVGPDTSEKLSSLEDSMGDLMRSSSESFDLGCDGPKVGAVYMLLEEDEGVAYNRVRVLKVDGEQALVKFLDHGETDVVNIERMKVLPAKYNQLPYQAIPAKLTGLESFEKNETIGKQLVELAFGKTFVATVDDRVDRVSLTLWDTSDDSDKNINEMVAKVLKIEDLSPQIPSEKGATLEGYVSFVAENGHIYFQIQGPGLVALAQITLQMTHVYEKECTADMFVSKPIKGRLYCTRYSNDNWYRVKVAQILPGRRVEVYFVDCGNTDIVQLTKLRAITAKNSHIAMLPYQAVECVQFNLPPDDYEWTSQALDRVSDLCPDDELRVLEVVYPGAPPQIELYFLDDDNEMRGVSECLEKEKDLLFGDDDPDIVATGGTTQETHDQSQPATSNLRTLTPSHSLDNNINFTDIKTSLTIGPSSESGSSGDYDGCKPIRDDITSSISRLKIIEDSSSDFSSDPEFWTPRTSPFSSSAMSPERDLNVVNTNLGVKPSLYTQDTLVNSQSKSQRESAVSVGSESDGGKVTLNDDLNQSVDNDSYRAGHPQHQQYDNILSEAVALRKDDLLVTNSHLPASGLSTVLTNSFRESSLSEMSVPKNTEDKSLADPCSGASGDVMIETSRDQNLHERNSVSVMEDLSNWGDDLDPSVSKLLPLPPPIEYPMSGDDIFITWVVDPWNFWAIVDSHQDDLGIMMHQMLNYYEIDHPVPAIEDILELQMYAGYYEESWYRVTIKGIITEKEQVKVHFVDYGDYTVLHVSDIRILPLRFRTHPCHAFQCKLEGVKPPRGDSTWSQESTHRLTDLIQDKRVTAWIHNQGQGFITHDNALSVTLVNCELEGNAFIHKILIDEDLASK